MPNLTALYKAITNISSQVCSPELVNHHKQPVNVSVNLLNISWDSKQERMGKD